MSENNYVKRELPSRKYAWFAASFTVIVWGASFIATKIALRDVSPMVVVWLRFTVGLVVMGLVVWQRRQFTWPAKEEWGEILLLGFIGIAFHQWLQSTGLVTSQASTTAWIVASTPVFIALLGWMFLRERLGWQRSLGIGLAALGVLAVVSRGDLRTLISGRLGAQGDYLILLSAPNWAVFSVLSRHVLSTPSGRKASPGRMMLFVMLAGWGMVSVLFLAQAGWQEIPLLSCSGWLGIIFLGIFCSGLAYILWYDALEILPASQAGVFLYLEPVVAVVIAALLLAEPVNIAVLLGGGTILLGVWIVNRRSAKQVG